MYTVIVLAYFAAVIIAGTGLAILTNRRNGLAALIGIYPIGAGMLLAIVATFILVLAQFVP